jgi:hypothetical protein
MVQLHVLHLSGASAQGIVSQLNRQWVHLTRNPLGLVALLVLVPRLSSTVEN